MFDAGRIKTTYRRFAETECKGYSDIYYRLALAVSEDDEVIGFIVQLPVIQPPMVSAGDLVDDLAAALADASKHRDLVWLSNEPPGVIPELTCLAPSASESRFLLGRTRFTNGRRSDELLALAHPHGAELVWL
jgi:Uncharacterized protein conserved in bacteria (DUF2332)